MDILLILLISLLTPYVVLGVVILVYGRQIKIKKNYNYRASVTVFVATYNEERFIEKKLKNLLQQSYPIKEILVFDCSTDKTSEIVEAYQRSHPNIELVKQPKRIGMARTMNDAFAKASGDIFIKSDCDTLMLSADCIKEVVADFADEKIGGVTGIYKAEKGMEIYYRKFMTTIQIAETNIDSTFIGHPGLLAFRKSAIQPIDENSLADDTEELLLIRQKGFRTILDPGIECTEEIPENFVTGKLQRARRAQGIIRVLFDNAKMVFNPKYGKFGSVVLPMEWFIPIISPPLLLAIAVTICFMAFYVNPLLPLALITPIIALLLGRTTILSAIVETEMTGLMGTLRCLTVRKSSGMWEKAR